MTAIFFEESFEAESREWFKKKTSASKGGFSHRIWISDGIKDYRQPIVAPQEWHGLSGSLTQLSVAIEASRSILSLVDEDCNPLASQTAWNRAVEFLNLYFGRSWDHYRAKLLVPSISPGPAGSIDLHWDHPGAEMLINIPADSEEPVTFYGDDKKGTSIRGSVPVVESYSVSVMLWLTTMARI